MSGNSLVWVASWPRSGNTYLRTILWQCFGLRSASIYPNDLGGNAALENYVGHIEHGSDGQVQMPVDGVPLIKTHGEPIDENPAIYVVRDGRAACVSMWKFYKRAMPLDVILEGRSQFGAWSDHVQSWSPWNRKNTLLLNYEDMRDNLPLVLKSLAEFLQRDVVTSSIPDRETIADKDGRWVRSRSDWRDDIPDNMLDAFNRRNKDLLQRLGYLFDESI